MDKSIKSNAGEGNPAEIAVETTGISKTVSTETGKISKVLVVIFDNNFILIKI
jgi:hypothetical protein